MLGHPFGCVCGTCGSLGSLGEDVVVADASAGTTPQGSQALTAAITGFSQIGTAAIQAGVFNRKQRRGGGGGGGGRAGQGYAPQPMYTPAPPAPVQSGVPGWVYGVGAAVGVVALVGTVVMIAGRK